MIFPSNLVVPWTLPFHFESASPTYLRCEVGDITVKAHGLAPSYRLSYIKAYLCLANYFYYSFFLEILFWSILTGFLCAFSLCSVFGLLTKLLVVWFGDSSASLWTVFWNDFGVGYIFYAFFFFNAWFISSSSIFIFFNNYPPFYCRPRF